MQSYMLRLRASLLVLAGIALPLAVRAATISGTVTGPDATPLPGIFATAYAWDGTSWNWMEGAQTAGDGTYTIDSLPAGTYRVQFDDYNGYEYFSEAYDNALDLEHGADIVVLEETAATGIDASLGRICTISGTVTGPDATPLPGIQASAYKWNGSGWDQFSAGSTDASGVYIIGWLPAATYRVQFDDYQNGDYVSEVYDDATGLASGTDIVLSGATNAIDATLALASKISGTVTGPNGAPLLPDVQAYAYQWNGSSWDWKRSAYTDAGGVYTIGGLPAGTYRVGFQVSNPDYISQWYDNKPNLASGTDVVVPVTTTVPDIDASLALASKISGTLTGPDESPLQGIQAIAYAWNGSSWDWNRSAYTDASGDYTIGGLTGGTYRVWFYDLGGEYFSEAYDDANGLASGTDIAVPATTTVPDIDASLAAALKISGTVTKPNGTMPLPGIEVTAYVWSGSSWDYTGSVNTDGSGHYAIGWLVAGTYRVQFYDPLGLYLYEVYDDATDFALGTDIVVSGATSGIDASLALAPNSEISGTVTGPGGTTLLPGIEVTAYHWIDSSWDWSTSANTDASGVYTISGLPAGTYRVRFDDYQNGDYATEVYDNATDLDSGTDIVVSGARTGIDASLAAASSISGTVTGPNGAPPLPGIEVSAYAWNGSGWDYTAWANTDVAGDYTIGGLPAGTYRVGFYDYQNGDYLSEWYDDAPAQESGTDIDVPAGTTVDGIDAWLAVASKISGTVTGPDESPLPGIYVRAYTWDGSSWNVVRGVNTDVTGFYTIGGLTGGTYRVQFHDYGGDYLSQVYDDATDLASGTDIVVPVATTVPDIDASLAQASKISGTVTGPDQSPLPGINVSAYTRNGSSWDWVNSRDTDANGAYTIGGLTGGTYRVQFYDYAEVYLSQVYDDAQDLASGTDITVPVATIVPDIDASLAQASKISGTVTGPDESPLPGIEVRAYAWNGSWWNVVRGVNTDVNGLYTIGGLTGGTYRVRFYDYGGEYLSEVYDNATDLDSGTDVVVSGAKTGIDASLALATKISGTVTGPDESPLQGIAAYAYNWDGSYWNVYAQADTDASGNYTIGGLTGGTYRVKFADWQNGVYAKEVYDDAPDLGSGKDIVVPAGTTVSSINASLATASWISGTVTGPGGTTLLPGILVGAYRWNGASSWYGTGWAYTDASGNYSIGGLSAGTYRVLFTDPGGDYLSEYYDDAPEFASARDIDVPALTTVTGINASLASAAPPEPPVIVGLRRTGADAWELRCTGTMGEWYTLQEALSATGTWGDVGSPFQCQPGTNVVPREQSAPVMFWQFRAVP